MVTPVYWYISKSKVNSLKAASPSSLAEITAKFNFKIGSFLSGSLARKNVSNVAADLTRVRNILRSEYLIKQYHELDETEAPVWLAFSGPATRLVNEYGFWLGMRHSNAGLILGGSPGFAIGSSFNKKFRFNTSVDPIATLAKSFQGVRGPHVGNTLLIAWATLMKDFSTAGALPTVEGLAIFSRAFHIKQSLMQSATKVASKSKKSAKDTTQVPHIERLVIGSPLYVQQV